MFHWKLSLFIAIIWGACANSQENTGTPFSFRWDNGFKLKSQDSLFSLEFGGSLLIDHGYLYQNSELTDYYGPLESKSGTEIRRARLFFSGDIYRNTHFKFQVDFSGDEVEIKDAFIRISKIPAIGNFQIGHFKEPFRLSVLTSSKYSTFMEAGANSYFSQSRNNGVIVFNDFLNKKLSAQFGAFRNADNDSNDVLANDGYALTGRITGIPFRNDSKKQLLHLGMGHSFRKPDSREYEISVSPGAHLARKYLKTENISLVEKVVLTNYELAYIHGPLSVQAEYLNASVNTFDYVYHFSNYYTELSYFITGESKNYKDSYEGFGRVKPHKNFGGVQNGLGALEVALRYSKAKLNDGLIIAGIQTELALGVNWYLNPATRLMVNYVKANVEERGSFDGIQGRFQIDF